MASIYRQIVELVDSSDWSVGQENNDYIEFSIYTPCGQDFNFSIEIDDSDTLSDIADKVDEYIDGFDVDYEASLWIGEDGHGKNGAPYHIKDIVEDMEAAKEKMQELSDMLRE